MMFWNKSSDLNTGFGIYMPIGRLYRGDKDGYSDAAALLQTSVDRTAVTLIDVYLSQWMAHYNIASIDSNGKVSLIKENNTRGEVIDSLSLFHPQRDRVEYHIKSMFINCNDYNGREQIDFLYAQLISVVDITTLSRLATGFYHAAVTLTGDAEFWPYIHMKYPYTWLIGRMQEIVL